MTIPKNIQAGKAEKDKYAMHQYFLYFLDRSVESLYRKFILEKAILFARISWIIIIILGISFSILDNHFFGESAHFVTGARIAIILVALLALLLSRSEKHSHLMDWNGFLIVFGLGIFCDFQILLDTTQEFSIYFTGLFLIFPGIFAIPGLGFRYSSFALILNLIGFNILFGLIIPMPSTLFLAYNMFLGGMILIYLYLGFLLEKIFRTNYGTTEKLKASLIEVHQLSGLLPMCAKCKKIRDDKGYWQRVETYIEAHTHAEFTHGLCPGCLESTYGDKKWFKKIKK